MITFLRTFLTVCLVAGVVSESHALTITSFGQPVTGFGSNVQAVPHCATPSSPGCFNAGNGNVRRVRPRADDHHAGTIRSPSPRLQRIGKLHIPDHYVSGRSQPRPWRPLLLETGLWSQYDDGWKMEKYDGNDDRDVDHDDGDAGTLFVHAVRKRLGRLCGMEVQKEATVTGRSRIRGDRVAATILRGERLCGPRKAVH